VKLPVAPPFPPMEAQTAAAIPGRGAWLYEPKWDGFRCLAFRDGADVYLQSKALKPLGRYFPEVVEAMLEVAGRRFVLDGELVIPVAGALSFDDLLQRIHPAASRVRRLAAETPALFIAFDLLVDERGRDLSRRPLEKRRERLEAFAAARFGAAVRLSPATLDVKLARRWLEELDGVDGVIAKRMDLPYMSGERAGMKKVKRLRTADCVVGGFRYASSKAGIGSLLLGLYGADGLLHHVGFTSSLPAAVRAAALQAVEARLGGTGFTGRAPGGPSRWSTGRSAAWEPLRPELVVEVEYDHVSGGRFRHGTRFVRWRPDKPPQQCTLEQLERATSGSALRLD
jgi:ATP-dependent DNA ligase